LIFFANSFQLGDSFKVFGPAGSSLNSNQCFEIQTWTAIAEDFEWDGFIDEVLVDSTANDFAKEIDIPELCCEGEIETRFERGQVQLEGQAGRGTTEVWVWGERAFTKRRKLSGLRWYTISRSWVNRLEP
jgi:hypothetical protein